MCLFKVVLRQGENETLVAEGVAVLEAEGGKVNLYRLAAGRVATLDNVEVVKVDSPNEVIVLREKTG